MRYVRRDLNPQEIQDIEQRSHFEELAPTEGSASGPHVTYASTVPAGRSARGSVSVFIQQAQVPGGDSGLNRFTISIAGCGVEERCSVIRGRAERASEQVVNQRLPLDGSGISAVFFGDANRDGLTDVLVRFSDGSGSLYQARQPRPAGAARTTLPTIQGNGGAASPIVHEAPTVAPQSDQPAREHPVSANPEPPRESRQALPVTIHSQPVTGTVSVDEDADGLTYLLMQGVYELLYRSSGAY